MSMKKLYALSALLFIFILPTCRYTATKPQADSSTQAPLQNPPLRFDEEIPQTPVELPNDTTEEPLEQTSPYWDVTTVDVSYISQERKLLSFTFDDAPSRQLENLLAVFAGFNEQNPDCKATATVFCNGYLFDETSAHTLSMSLALGWELGNHSYSHPDLTTLGLETLREEIEKTDEILYKLDGKKTHLFRPPYGRYDDALRKACPTPIVNWTIDTLDWSGTSVDDIVEQVLTQKADGSIVLMHDNCPNTVEALKILLPKLKDEGYQVVSLSALAKMHQCALKQGSVYIRARKNGNG